MIEEQISPRKVKNAKSTSHASSKISSDSKSKIEFKNVNKSIAKTPILKNVSFTVNPNTITSLVGLSGSGKTTTLRAINRLHEIDSGEILIDGKNIKDRTLFDLRSRIGYVIQNAGLFSHLTIGKNLKLVRDVQLRRVIEEEKRKLLGEKKQRTLMERLKLWKTTHERVKIVRGQSEYSKENFDMSIERLFKILHLKLEHLGQMPAQLSGGQLQRVGIVRALLTNAEIILMDEPFSSLDPIVRRKLQIALVKIKNNLQKTIIFVSHDPTETLAISDKIIVLDKGETKFIGTPMDIKNSKNKFIRELFFYNKIKKSELEED